MINIDFLIPLFSNYGIIILLVCGVIGGEELIISLVFFSIMGLFPLWWILVFVTLGEFISDLGFFSLGRTKIFYKFKKMDKLVKVYEKADRFIIKISRESVFLTLLYSKFIYGTRIFTLVYLSSKKIKWRKFLVSEVLVLIVWMSITVLITWFSGVGIKKVNSIFKNTELTITLIFVFIIAIIMLRKWIQVKLLEKQKD